MSQIIKVSMDPSLGLEIIEFYQSFMQSRYSPMISLLAEKGLWSSKIEQVIFCQNVADYIEEYNQKYGTAYSLTQEKEFGAVSKNISFDGLNTTILVPILIADDLVRVALVDKLFINQVILVKADELLPEEFEKFNFGLSFDDVQNLDFIIQFLFQAWFCHDFTSSILFEIEESVEESLTNHEHAMAVFKRKLKKKPL